MGAAVPHRRLMMYERSLQDDLHNDKKDMWRVVREHVSASIAEAKSAAQEALNQRRRQTMWLNPDIRFQVNAPLTSTMKDRSPDLLEKVILQFDVHAARYAKRDIDGNGTVDTFCNFRTRDISRAMNCPLPEGLRANEMVTWLQTDRAKLLGWEEHDEHTAQRCADEGMFVVAAWANPNPKASGHIAPLMPARGEPGTFISNVGGTFFERGPLSRGFGDKRPRFWVHP